MANKLQSTLSRRVRTFLLALLGAIGLASIVLLSLKGIIKWDLLANPLIVALVAAIFVYLTLDRLREINARIDALDDRSVELWQSVLKEIEDVASRQAEAKISQMQTGLQATVDKLNAEVEALLKENPWLREASPNDLALRTKHLEPLLVSLRSMIRKLEFDTARKMAIHALDDPETQGTANDYHNLGVVLARDLDDNLLALRAYETYSKRVTEPNADVLADALSIYTRTEEYDRGKSLADTIASRLEARDPAFSERWRPWVFLSDFYVGTGDVQRALLLLQKGLESVHNPDDRPHVLRNLADMHLKQGDRAKARQVLLQCIEEFPSYLSAPLSLAELDWLEGNEDSALKTLDSIVSRGNIDRTYDRVFATAHAYLARLHLAKGDDKRAIHHVRHASGFGAADQITEVLTILATANNPALGMPPLDLDGA